MSEKCQQPFCAQPFDKAPLFVTDAYDNIDKQVKQITLQDYIGKWVILFFYASDFSFVWPTELAAVAAINPQLQSLNTEVLAISTDSIYSHKVFTETSPSAMTVNFPLLSDRSHQISKAYRVLNEKTGVSLRATIIINPEGTIVAKLVNPREVGRNVYEIVRIIQGLQYSEISGESVPANWVPGEPGIRRNINYAGKI